MSAPSALHELRVRHLEVMATLAGFSVEMRLYPKERPDLVRAHVSRPAIFLADAKATEQPSDKETRRRILRYLTSSGLWARAGFDVAVVVCHGRDRDARWAAMLDDLSAIAAHPLTVNRACQLDEVTWITSARLEAQPELGTSAMSQLRRNRDRSFP